MAPSSSEDLNAAFGDDRSVVIESGGGGFPEVLLQNRYGETRISTHGAHVLSYRPTDQDEVIFVSEQAVYEKGKAIRGGIPVCTPWFAGHPTLKDLPFHGFGRTRPWTLVGAGSGTAEEASAPGHHAVLAFQPEPAVLDVFPFPFTAQLEVHLGEELTVSLSVTNAGQEALEITGALHSYFRIAELEQVSVEGLDGVSYLDKVEDFAKKQQSGAISFTGEVDRIYEDTESDCEIRDLAGGRVIRVGKSGSRSTVVWNPGAERATAMGDLPDAAYLEFVCVETTNAGSDVVTVLPGESHRLQQRIGVSRN